MYFGVLEKDKYDVGNPIINHVAKCEIKDYDIGKEIWNSIIEQWHDDADLFIIYETKDGTDVASRVSEALYQAGRIKAAVYIPEPDDSFEAFVCKPEVVNQRGRRDLKFIKRMCSNRKHRTASYGY